MLQKHSTTIYLVLIGLTAMVIGCVTTGLGQPTIQSPEVAALNKYIDFPVDKSTGTPSIGIPLYTLEYGDFSVPISLSYHAGGIKVDETAGSSGLGWTLNVAGVISRSVKDLPDEVGYYSTHGAPAYQIVAPIFDEYGHMTYVPRMYGDSQPDLFYFNISGFSGKFVIDKNRKVHVIPEQDLKVEIIGDFQGFKITSPDGSQQFFSTAYTDFPDINEPPPTAWHLSKIITPAQKTIDFQYVQHGYSMDKVLNLETKLMYLGYPANFTLPLTNQKITYRNMMSMWSISRITSEKYTVDFTYQTNSREDFRPGSPMYALQKISVRENFSQSLVRKFLFSTSYFTAVGTGPLGQAEDYHKKRLRLDALQECDGEGHCHPAYKFSYNKYNPTPNNALPTRLSFGQDLWGFYNGHDENTELFPTMRDPDDSNIVYAYTNNNRDPVESYSTAFILDEVVFPTGGVTNYVFEGVRATSNSPLIGGLRVKEINTVSQSGSNLYKTYQYYNPVIVGGAPKFTQRIVGLFSGENAGDGVKNATNYALGFATPTITHGEVTTQYIFHEKVTESQPGNGSTESYFDIESVQNETADFQNNDYPIVSPMPVLLGNKLLREVVKDQSGNTLREILYTYGYYTRTAISAADAYIKHVPLVWEYYKNYGITTGCAYLKDKTEINYTITPAASYAVKTYFSHEGIPQGMNQGESLHHYVTKETTQLSDGSWRSNRSKYPLDYKSDLTSSVSGDTWDVESMGLKTLIDRWMIGAPIEQLTTVTKNGIEQIIGGNLITFKKTDFTNPSKTYVVPTATFGFDLAQPVNYTASSWSAIVKTSGQYSFNRNTNHKAKTYYDLFDSHGNLLQYHLANELPTTFLWGYQGEYPVAKIYNATHQEVVNELGQNVVDDLNGNTGDFNEIRETLIPLWQSVNLAKSRIMTFSFHPVFGMTSMTDFNNKITLYDYDSFGRLRFIKDSHQMITKSFIYHYKNP